MSYRKLQYKNVGATRSTHVIGAGEVAVDPETYQIYIGDGSTAGGIEIKADSYSKYTQITDEYTVSKGEKIYTFGSFDINVPTTDLEIGDWFEVIHEGSSGTVTVQTPTPVSIGSNDRVLFVYNGDDPSFWTNFKTSQ